MLRYTSNVKVHKHFHIAFTEITYITKANGHFSIFYSQLDPTEDCIVMTGPKMYYDCHKKPNNVIGQSYRNTLYVQAINCA